MISTPSPPPAPDPAATIKASEGSNASTAIANTQGNAINQVTPYGNLNYTHTPSDINLGGVNVPQWTATQTLSPEEQALFNTNEATKGVISNIGLDQSQRIGGLLGTPVDLTPSATGATTQYLTDLGRQRLDPQFQREWNDQETTLMNRGIMPGSEQYQLAQDAFNRQKNDAYNQLYLGGQGQAQQALLAERNQPINEITALLSGSQVSQPNFVNTPQTTVAPTDVAGITNNAYQGQLAQYGIQQGAQNALIGGLAGLGGAALGGWGAYNGFNGLLPKRA